MQRSTHRTVIEERLRSCARADRQPGCATSFCVAGAGTSDHPRCVECGDPMQPWEVIDDDDDGWCDACGGPCTGLGAFISAERAPFAMIGDAVGVR